MKRYINNKKDSIVMRFVNILLLIVLCSCYVFSANDTINVTASLGGNQVEEDNILFIDFNNFPNSLFIIIFFILLILSFLVIIHPINSFLLLIFSIMLMANGFNLFLAFILMLISILFITISTKK